MIHKVEYADKIENFSVLNYDLLLLSPRKGGPYGYWYPSGERDMRYNKAIPYFILNRYNYWKAPE